MQLSFYFFKAYIYILSFNFVIDMDAIPLWPDTWTKRKVGEAEREKQFGTPLWMFKSFKGKKFAQELMHNDAKVHEAVHGARWYEDEGDDHGEIRGGISNSYGVNFYRVNHMQDEKVYLDGLIEKYDSMTVKRLLLRRSLPKAVWESTKQGEYDDEIPDSLSFNEFFAIALTSVLSPSDSSRLCHQAKKVIAKSELLQKRMGDKLKKLDDLENQLCEVLLLIEKLGPDFTDGPLSQ
jgi:hypothetical protein